MTPEEALGDGPKKVIQDISCAYGISNYYRFVVGDTQKADALCQKILDVGKDGMSHPFGYQAAMAELAKASFVSLTPELDEQIAKDPANEYLWYWKIHAYSKERDLVGAVREASIAMVNVNDKARFLQGRGHWYTNLGQYEQSACDFTRACLLRPEDKNVLYHYGLAHYLLGEYKRAEKIYKRALDAAASASESISTTNWLWATLVHQKKDAEAQALLDATVLEGPIGAPDKTGYDRLLALYKGILPLEDVVPKSDDYSLEDASFLYGLSNYYYYIEKSQALADQTLDRIMATIPEPLKTCFGYRATLNERERRQRYPS